MWFLIGAFSGLLVSFIVSVGSHRVVINELSESLKQVRRVLGRGDVSRGILMLENIEGLLEKWRRPTVRDD
jgi:hypothetical protein